MRPGRKSGVGRPTLGRWCLLEAPANSGERAGGRSASTSPTAPGRSSPVLPFACHIEGSIPVRSGQPRSHLRHRRAGRPRRASKNALLRPLRSRTTCKNAGLHSGKRVIADKDEAAGSSPARPTTPELTCGNACLLPHRPWPAAVCSLHSGPRTYPCMIGHRVVMDFVTCQDRLAHSVAGAPDPVECRGLRNEQGVGRRSAAFRVFRPPWARSTRTRRSAAAGHSRRCSRTSSTPTSPRSPRPRWRRRTGLARRCWSSG